MWACAQGPIGPLTFLYKDVALTKWTHLVSPAAAISARNLSS